MGDLPNPSDEPIKWVFRVKRLETVTKTRDQVAPGAYLVTETRTHLEVEVWKRLHFDARKEAARLLKCSPDEVECIS